MNDTPNENRVRRRRANNQHSGRHEAQGREVRDNTVADLACEQAGPGRNRSWTSVATIVAVAVAVIAIPLHLKSSPSADARAEANAANGPASVASSATSGQALPRFVDLGTTTCIPCKVMLGVMEELKRDYPGAFIVDFVNVKEDPEETEQYNIRTIPTQIFYAPDGRELYRHVGVFRSEEIIAKWAELGYRFERATAK